MNQTEQTDVIPPITQEAIQAIQSAYTAQVHAFTVYQEAKTRLSEQGVNDMPTQFPFLMTASQNEANEAMRQYVKAQNELITLMVYWLPTLLSITTYAQSLVHNHQALRVNTQMVDTIREFGTGKPEFEVMKERILQQASDRHNETFASLIALFVPIIQELP